jgi:hypothetical protein
VRSFSIVTHDDGCKAGLYRKHFSARILRVQKVALLNFKSARSFLSTLYVHAARALLWPSSLKLGGDGLNDSEDCGIFSDLSQYELY